MNVVAEEGKNKERRKEGDGFEQRFREYLY